MLSDNYSPYINLTDHKLLKELVTMPIIGMGLSMLEAKKEGTRMQQQEVKVNSTPQITGVKEVEVPNLTKKALSMDFEFMTRYEPDFASIAIKGSIMYLAEKNKPIIDEWDKNKRLPDNVSLEVLNYLFRHCLLKASILADDLQLPPPMPMPRVTPNKSKQVS